MCAIHDRSSEGEFETLLVYRPPLQQDFVLKSRVSPDYTTQGSMNLLKVSVHSDGGELGAFASAMTNT
jgi:hypothetical protein